MKRITVILLTCCLFLALAAGCKKDSDTPILSTKKANDDFSDLFKVAAMGDDALVALTVKKVAEVTDVIEYYDVIDTTYTKVTATVDREFTEQLESKEITLYILGNAQNFPSREKMVEGRSYLLRLESWVHQDGVIWLVSPLESTYLRIFEGEILVHESAADLNYKKALTPDAFEKQYKEYLAEHPVKEGALKEHYREILSTLNAFDYEDKEMAYHLDAEAIAARKKLAEDLIKNAK